jgi:hypothetical protein
MSTYVSEVCAASIIIALMMEAARTSGTSINIQLRTRQHIPEDSELQEVKCYFQSGVLKGGKKKHLPVTPRTARPVSDDTAVRTMI